ncbi:MAG TPA: hypothetical protein VG317_17160 [Pseudonocardiaceae bacterium]|jgi:hypothetical protein|nr:hypothetical protein [Pseudonocardiaceae bacterium]
MDMTGMAAGGSGGGVDVVAIVLRIAVLLPTTVLAGLGIARPAVRSVARPTTSVAWLAALIAATADLVSIPVIGASVPFVVAQAVLTVALPVLLRWPTLAAINGIVLALLLVAEYAASGSGAVLAVDVLYLAAVLAWLGLAALSLAKTPTWRPAGDRLRLTASVAAAILVLAGIGYLVLSGLAFDSRLYGTGYGIALLAALVLALLVAGVAVRTPRDHHNARAYQFGALGVLLSFLVCGTLVALPKPAPAPVAGTPVLARVSLSGKDVPVLVTPGRPGVNLVHFPDGAGTGISVSVGSGPPVDAVAQPGAEGTWARLRLPAGEDQLVVRRGTGQGTVDLNTGVNPGPTAASGVDGPECASAALGDLVAGQHDPLASCPADALDPSDAQALADLVGFLKSRHTAGITVTGDSSPRSTRAAALVRQTAAADQLPVTSTAGADSALVVVSGWSAATGQLSTVLTEQASSVSYGYGVYLAPWLLNPPVVRSIASSLLPLRFDPRVATSLSYSVAVQNTFGGENATPDGYYRWLAAQGQPPPDGGVQVYATAQVDAMPMDGPDMADMSQPYPGQWIPGGTIVPVSAVLGRPSA